VLLKVAAGNPTVINIREMGVKILRNLFMTRINWGLALIRFVVEL